MPLLCMSFHVNKYYYIKKKLNDTPKFAYVILLSVSHTNSSGTRRGGGGDRGEGGKGSREVKTGNAGL